MMTDLTEKKLRQIVDEAIDQNKTVLQLKREIIGIKQEQQEMKREIKGIKQEQQEMKQELHRQGIIQEDMQSNLKLLVEAVSPLLNKSAEMSDFDQTLKDHHVQIKVTQKAHPTLQ